MFHVGVIDRGTRNHHDLWCQLSVTLTTVRVDTSASCAVSNSWLPSRSYDSFSMSVRVDSLSVTSADAPVYDHPRIPCTPTSHPSCHSITCDCNGCTDPELKMDCRFKTFPSIEDRSSLLRQLQHRSEALRRHIHLIPNGATLHFDKLVALTSIQLDIVGLNLMEGLCD